MITSLTHPLRLITALLLGTAVFAQDPAPPADEKPMTRDEALAKAGIKTTKGPATVKLGMIAELKLTEGQDFIGEDSIEKYLQITQNPISGKEKGVLHSTDGWAIFFDYDAIGYVKDDDKDKLDADKLLKSITDGQNAANESRRSRGWTELNIRGWATKPHYDEKTNNLKWAINLSSSQDGHKAIFINESIRILGRSGVVEATLVCDTDLFKASEAAADQLLATNFSFVSGEKYSEFKSGDKIAEYGLTALVLGGAGVIAAKTGLLASLGVMLGKFWKVIVGGLIAIGVGIQKFFQKLSGKKDDDQHPPLRG